MDPQKPSQLSAICRPSNSIWLAVIGCAFMGIAGTTTFLTPTPPQHTNRFDIAAQIIFLFTSAALIVAAVAVAYWALRARVIVSEEGLRWRHFGRWTDWKWDAVTDYYLKPYNSDWDTLVVEAGGAKLRLIPFTKHFWRNTNEFRAAVSARALSSVVGEWKALGCRQNELISLEFVYPTSTHRRKVFISTSLWLGSTFGMGFGIVHSSEVIALGMGWLTSLMLGVTVFFTTSMWWVGTFLNMEALRRKRHHIATGVEGISFSDGVHRIHAPWASITRYERTDLGEILATRQRYVVHTSDGDFDFTPAITDFLLLDRIIREQAAEYQFNVSTTETDALGGESACWSGGYAGKGDRIFHYRTRGHRALLWMGTLMTLVLPFAYQIGLYAEIPHHPGDPPPAAIYSIIVLVTMWGWGRYYSARIEISEIGISEHSAFGTKHLRWTEIVSVTESNNVITLHGDGKKVRYWDTIVNAADLDSEIERRAVKCTIRHDKDGKNK